MVFRNVIVCRMVPGSEKIVGDVFGHYDKTTRPQDLGVIGRILLSHHDLYLHVIERKQDPKVSGQTRGLPAFQQIAEAIAPYVTPYPRYWTNPSDSVAKEFYRWVPDGKEPEDTTLTVIVGRIKPGAEPDVARVFAESDAGPLPAELGVTGRWLYAIDDVYVHLLEQDASLAEATRHNHDKPAFSKVMEDLSPYISPYRPDLWRGPQDSVAKPYYRWRAED
ncbi:TcmI family type II polyketide cyclase [Micromonospora sp. DR5-3]|uniref:TcmI family type II polyketide cyclase n=1 Tax=unclassified Micromonospora TaxID=2617518 RepID=UPI0011D5C59D|nr:MULTISPECIES: TcmI family type II polyketide cyclase [unclassified Micromonospora]MCW3816914.1 TcmI family type II polyketide cyclase [Micromonospora sp. DR5-3]TYC23414.1 TcmI family type II polyketide cyclase [Micromonospora sp. MP36]